MVAIVKTKRLPAVRPLSQVLPSGAEGGKEFGRIVDLLLFNEAKLNGENFTAFNDAAGDYAALDSFSASIRSNGKKGFQYKFYSSPLTAAHRTEIKNSLESAAAHAKHSSMIHWVIVTPDDFSNSATRKGGGDLTWFEDLRASYKGLEIEHYGHTKLQALFIIFPHLALYYYPEIVMAGTATRKTYESIRESYSSALRDRYGKIEFVGMSVYKEEATKGVPLEHIYIPLSVVGEDQDDSDDTFPRINPLDLLTPGSRSVVLGDPGSGKSTLMSFLALSGLSPQLQAKFKLTPDGRLPVVVTLRRYVDELKTRYNLSILDYVIETMNADFSQNDASIDFLQFYLEAGKAVFLFDGLDELPSPQFKTIVRDRIAALSAVYPLATIVITSRIVGYEGVIRFPSGFRHYRMARLRIFEIRKFIEDWYQIRVDNANERKANVTDLSRIIENPDSTAIRDLARNPLLLTIVALVHRIDAVLPDERVVLYQKCTETLLNTWYRWKFKDEDERSKGKVERRNRRRIESVAYWMQCRSVDANHGRAVVPYGELVAYLAKHIEDKELVEREDAFDEATNFLNFVKSRTGLLIEAGDELYSFLHLTFQEYLTATYLISQGEYEGVSQIWSMIGSQIDNPRWHEVARLLVASLKSDEGQQFFLDKIGGLSSPEAKMSKTLLLGGLVLDGIDPAERIDQSIMGFVFDAAFATNSIEDLPPLERTFRSWVQKRSVNRISATEVFSRSAQSDGSNDPLRHVLTALALGVDEHTLRATKLLEKVPHTHPFSDSAALRLLGAAKIKSKSLSTVHSVCDLYALESPETNLISVMYTPFLLGADRKNGWLKTFKRSLLLLLTSAYGPFHDFTSNVFSLASASDAKLTKEVSQRIRASRRGAGSQFKDRFEIIRDRLQPFSEIMRREFDPSTSKVKQARSLSRSGGVLSDLREKVRRTVGPNDLSEIDHVISRSQIDGSPDGLVDLRHSLRSTATSRSSSLWLEVQSNSAITRTVSESLVGWFELRPEPQWAEVLRLSLFPSIPNYMTSLVSASTQSMLIDNIRDANRSSNISFHIAWLILADLWLWAKGWDDDRSPPPFYQPLLNAAASATAPAIRLALMINRAAKGSEKDVGAIADLLASGQSEEARLLAESYWTLDRSG